MLYNYTCALRISLTKGKNKIFLDTPLKAACSRKLFCHFDRLYSNMHQATNFHMYMYSKSTLNGMKFPLTLTYQTIKLSDLARKKCKLIPFLGIKMIRLCMH